MQENSQETHRRLAQAAENLQEALVQTTGRALFVSPDFPNGPLIAGRFEVRTSRGEVKRLEQVTLPLPPPLYELAKTAGLPSEIVRIDTKSWGRIALWPLKCLIELQVGHRWHGFRGKIIPEWDADLVVFAERGTSALCLRLSEEDGPVWECPDSLESGLIGAQKLLPLAPSLGDFLQELSQELAQGAPVMLLPADEMA